MNDTKRLAVVLVTVGILAVSVGAEGQPASEPWTFLLDDRIAWQEGSGQTLSMTFAGMTLTRGFCRVISGESDIMTGTFGAESMTCDLLLSEEDRAQIGGVGVANGAEPLGGSVTGFAFPPERKVTCRNGTTLQMVQFFTASDSWDCEAEGLEVSSGDRVLQTVVGDV